MRQDEGMYTSEPVKGLESPFYAGATYYANAEDARRARLEIAHPACLWCGGRFVVGFGAFCSRACAMAEVGS
jgi:hypothetical protein